MSEASTGGGRTEMERMLAQRCLEDEAFRRQLLEDPKAVVERELGTPLPSGITVRAVEETADTVYLVLPPASQAGTQGELSDGELEAVAGGGWENASNSTCGFEYSCGGNC